MAQIRIRGARENNLKGIDVGFGDGLTVVTGVSGSGKSSLVFDTLFHEAKRRLMDVFDFGGSLRLSPAHVDSLTGIGPAVAVEQNLLNRNPASTLATFSGLHPFLRMLYARFGERSCAVCGEPFIMMNEDEITESIIAFGQDGVLALFVPLLRGIPGSHATLLRLLSAEFGNDAILVDKKVWEGLPLAPTESHHIDIKLVRWENAPTLQDTRKAIQQAWSMGADAIRAETPNTVRTLTRAPVCAQCGTWFSALEPMLFNLSCPQCHGAGCPACDGSGRHPEAAATRWQGLRLHELLALPVEEARTLFLKADFSPGSNRLRSEILSRLDALMRVGLGYPALDRPTPTLSRGESQRVRLAVILISRLEDMLHVLDEPTVGQHPADVAGLLDAFRALPGPVVFVEHDRVAAAAADHAIDMGPGAGSNGGEVVFTGTPAALWAAETDSGQYFSLRKSAVLPSRRPNPESFLLLEGANSRNLRNIDIPVALRRFNVITGVSGSGKSTLVREVLVPTLSSGKATGCAAYFIVSGEGAVQKNINANPLPEAIFVDQSPIGRNPRSNPATYTKLADVIRDFWATQTGKSPSHFSFNRPEGACTACKGLGAVEVPMRYLPSAWIPCEECGSQRFSEEVLAATVVFGDRILSISDFYNLGIQEILKLMQQDSRMTNRQRAVFDPILHALCDIGLGYLKLGQPSPTLSGGEAQRIKLAKYLGQKNLSESLLILDEPSTGLHPKDVTGLLIILDRLVRNGATVVVVEHDTDTIRAADWVIDLGPGAGPKGGQLIYAGRPDGLAASLISVTGRALREEADLHPHSFPNRKPNPFSTHPAAHVRTPVISIRNARANNLKSVDADIPKGTLTVVTGVSGSGKSSLVIDVLETEARRRLLESFSLYERQSMREGPEAPVDEIRGLGVVAAAGSTRGLHMRRATVGSVTELSHHLAVLMAWLGERSCLSCGAAMIRKQEKWQCACGASAQIAPPRFFQPNHYHSACTVCNGVGTMIQPNPSKLIIRPDLPINAGAMYSPGFFPKGYLGKPFNGGYDLVQALAGKYVFDPVKTPWNRMTPQAQHAFLFGDPLPMPVHHVSKTGRIHDDMQPFPGFYGWLRDWDFGGTYSDTEPCPKCGGSRLRPEYLAVRLCGRTLHDLNTMPLTRLHETLSSETTAPGMNVSPTLREQADPSLRTCLQRLRFLLRVGVGYMHIDRPASTVSAGEAQRLSLAGLLGSGLTDLTILLDEPTRGLHPSEVDALVDTLLELRGAPGQASSNTIVVVEHDPEVLHAADFILDMGPGAGAAGGTIVAQGTPDAVARADTATARWLRGERRPVLAKKRIPMHWMKILGAAGNNLKHLDVSLPLGVLTGLCGVSGSGKSTLLVDTIGLALAPKKQTTSVAYENMDPGMYESIENAPKRVIIVDQTRIGIRSPANYLGIEEAIHAMYAEGEDAKALGLDAESLSRQCAACGGTGSLRIDMGFLPDIVENCEACRGSGYRSETRELFLRGISLPDFFDLTIDEVLEKFDDADRLTRPLKVAQQVGLGYLTLRQPGHALSGGEAQRLKIADELAKKTKKEDPVLYILDEPTLGLHLDDVALLSKVLHRLVDGEIGESGTFGAGGKSSRGIGKNTVIVVEHHPHLLAACDWLIELGPVGGPEGGYLIAEGTPEHVASGHTPTARYLRETLLSATKEEEYE